MINYSKRVLDNGLSVVVEQDISTNMAAVNVLYKVGSRNESPDKTGFAHLFEHLMFGGSVNAPDFDKPLQLAGGESNAYTNCDYTNFYSLLPAQNIETALWLEADRMEHLIIDGKSLDIQKKVVIEEFKEVCLNKPYGDVWHYLSDMCYTVHPYKWPTIGRDISHIEDAALEDVNDFFLKFYHPSNAVLSISSPLSPNETFRIVEKWFGKIKAGKMPDMDLAQEPGQLTKRFKEAKGLVPAHMVFMAFHMPSRVQKDYYACDLISEIMANGKSSRLYNRLVKKQRLMSHVNCYISGSYDTGLIIFEGRPMPDTGLKETQNALMEEIGQLTTCEVSDSELQKAKNKVIASLAISDLSVLNKAVSMSYFDWLGELDNMNEQESRYQSVTSGDILNAAQNYLSANKINQLNYLPTQEHNPSDKRD